MYRQFATIKGRGEFPLDMLRYERACPHNEIDSFAVRETIAKGFGPPWEVTVVRFVPHKNIQWTTARWQSFGVEITPGQTEKIT